MKSKIEEIKGTAEDIHSETESDFDSKSEKWQEGEKGEEERTKIDALENLNSSLDDIISTMENAISELEEVSNDNE